GDFVGKGESKQFTPADGAFSVSATPTRLQLTFTPTAGSPIWYLALEPGAGDRFRPGVFRDVEHWPSLLSRRPQLSFSSTNGACDIVFGSFAVNQVAFDASGALRTFDATFTQRCDRSDAPALKGRFLYDAEPLSFALDSDPGDFIGRGVSKRYVNS